MEFDGSGRNTEAILGRSIVIFSPSEILPVAESTGFRSDVIEKVLHLLNLLNMLNSHPFLKGKLALKGGSALNLFVFNVPRLSVDIDLNYIGAVELEKMLADRPKVEQAVDAVFSQRGNRAVIVNNRYRRAGPHYTEPDVALEGGERL